jgi:cation transport regulator ChaB
LTVNNPAGAIQAYPPQGFGSPERIDRSDEQGVVFLSSFGNYYRVPKYTTSIIRKYQDNVYAAGVYHRQRHTLFRERYEIIIHDPEGETDTDECTAIANDMVKMLDVVMVQPHTYGLQAAIEMSWSDCFWFGISLFNPVWDWDGNVYTLQKLRHLPADSFGTQPYGRPFLYSDIMQGIVISPYDGSVEYFQTLYMPQNNAPPGPVVSTQFLQTKLTNIVTIKDPAFPDLAGKPVMLPIFPLIAMLDFTWQAQVQRVNRIGAPMLFLKIINPQGNDIEYGQLLLQNWGKNSGFQLRANFEIVDPGIQDSGSALETIEALNKLITQYFNPANQVQRSETAPLSGASGSEKEMVDDYTRNVHSWLETQWSHILQEYLDVNGYDGYTVEVDIPDPSIDRSTIELQQADKLFTTKTGLPNEIRKKLGVEDLDEAGLAELKEYYASIQPASPFGAFGGPVQPGAEEGAEPTPPGPEEEPAKGGEESPLMQKARLALEAVKADELNPDRYVEDDKVKKIVNAALDEGSVFPDPEKETVGGSGITQAAYWPSAGEVPADIQKILTESYQYASSASKYPPDSADRDREAREYAWQAVEKAGWRKLQDGQWVQNAGTGQKGGIQS